MYKVTYYLYTKKRTRTFKTLQEAFEFSLQLPFESFCEMHKIES